LRKGLARLAAALRAGYVTARLEIGLNGPVEVVIVGGGTAGWMAAAALTSLLPAQRCRVRLIESEEIGTVGVGEATLPHITTFNDSIGISEAEMMRRTNATFKLAIEFVDWGSRGSSYMHPFGVHGRREGGLAFQHRWVRAMQAGHALDLEEHSFAVAAGRANRFAFPSEDPAAIESTYSYAYHFDAALYAEVLRELAESRGAQRLEGKVVEVSLDKERGDIESLRLQSGEVIAGDFFIDCSGFRSLLLGQTLGVGYEEWTKWLPCDRAWAVPSPRVGELTPYTRSTALEAGWQWRIPLQHRTGNGYVFSTGFISEDEAAARVLGNLEAPASAEPRLLRFAAGRRDRTWEKNCLAVGLASGFLEPLESTSIYLIQAAILHLIPLFPEKRVDPVLPVEFNRRIDVEYERIRDFLILHYHANSRDDAELWRYCRNMAVPDSLTERMELFVHRGFIEEYRDGLFSPASWLSVYAGQGLRPARYDPLLDNVPIPRMVEELDALRREIRGGVARMLPHAQFVDGYCRSEAAPRLALEAGA
jgi:tryptophan halogenase